jgi:hypothetical protein
VLCSKRSPGEVVLGLDELLDCLFFLSRSTFSTGDVRWGEALERRRLS